MVKLLALEPRHWNSVDFLLRKQAQDDVVLVSDHYSGVAGSGVAR